MTLSLTVWNWLLALLPVLVVVVLMLVFRWGGSRAGGLGWFTAVAVSVLAFGAGFELLAYAQVKAVLLSLDVLFIIWTALLLFNIAREAGAITMIGQALPGLTGDPVMQSLLIGWLMVSFLQGMGGFGVPVAVCAPLLVGLGYTPIQAVAMAAIGHGWAVTFGSLASSFQTLMAVTGLPGGTLAPFSALLLGIAAFPSGLLVALIGNGWKGLKRALGPVLVISAVMGTVQYLLATGGLWTLGATGAGIAGLVVGFVLVRLTKTRAEPDATPEVGRETEEGKSLWLSLIAYGLLVVLAFSINLITPVDTFLGREGGHLPGPGGPDSPVSCPGNPLRLGDPSRARPGDQPFRSSRRDFAVYLCDLLYYLPGHRLYSAGRAAGYPDTGCEGRGQLQPGDPGHGGPGFRDAPQRDDIPAGAGPQRKLQPCALSGGGALHRRAGRFHHGQQQQRQCALCRPAAKCSPTS